MKLPLKIGFLGFGEWASTAYFPILSQRSDVQITAVSAMHQTTLNKCKKILGNSVQLFIGFEEFFKNASIDIVFIALPPEVSGKATELALKNKLHIFLEPPIKSNIDYLTQLNKKYSKVFQINLELNHLPVINTCKNLINDNLIGKILNSTINLECNWANSWRKNENEIRDFIIGLSTWYLAITDSFTQNKPIHSSFIEEQNNHTKGRIEVKYLDNYLGTWKFNLTTGLKTKMTLIVNGTTGLLKVNLLNGKLIMRDKNKIIEQIIQAHESILEFGGMHESITNFLDAIINKKKSITDFNQYLEINSIHQMLYNKNK